MKSREVEHQLLVLNSLLHNLSFSTRNKLGLIDHSLGCYGPVGMPGPKGLTMEQSQMNQVELEFSLEEEAERNIPTLINRLAKGIESLEHDVNHAELIRGQ